MYGQPVPAEIRLVLFYSASWLHGFHTCVRKRSFKGFLRENLLLLCNCSWALTKKKRLWFFLLLKDYNPKQNEKKFDFESNQIKVPCWAYTANSRTSAACPSGFLWWSGSVVCRDKSGPRLHRRSGRRSSTQQ